MGDFVFFGTLLVSLALVALLGYLLVKGFKAGSSEDEDSPRPVVNAPRRGQATMLGNVRHRTRNRNRPRDEDEDFEPEDFAGNVNYDDDAEDHQGASYDETVAKMKIGVKKQRKLEMKAEKKAAREQEQLEREERKKRQEELDEKRRLEDERERAEEKAKEEAERLEKERKEREEYEEYLKLKQSFAVDEEGFDGDVNEEDSQNKLQSFIDYIVSHKIVQMDELAGHFNLKTPEVVSRIQSLLESEQLIGVIDDRGKFISITNEELQAVGRFIKQRGRVSITDLVENSNSFINLVPVESDK